MLTIELKINGHLIASADVANVSDLADVSDYQVHAWTNSREEINIHNGVHAFKIYKHLRKQSPWALVRKVANIVALQEGAERVWR